MDITTSQSAPLFDDGPDALSQRNHRIRRREDPSFSRFRDAITQTTFGPVLRIDILFSHQPAHVEDDFDPKLSLQPKRDRRWYVRTCVYQLDLVSSHETARITDAGDDVVNSCRERWSPVIPQPVPFDPLSCQFTLQFLAGTLP